METETVENEVVEPEEEVVETGEEVENEPAEPEEETEEVEHEGKKYAIPKALKSALMMHADYTRKTQEIAETKRAAEAERTRYVQASEEYIADRAKLAAVDQHLTEFQKVNWSELTDEDPVAAQKLWLQFAQLKDSRQQMAAQLAQKEHSRTLDRQQMQAKLIEEGHAVLVRDIPEWSPEKGAKITAFAAKEFGFQPEELGNVFDPRIVKVLHHAYLYDQMIKKAKTTPKETPGQVQPVKAVATGKAHVAKDPSKMTDKEFAEWRKRQISQRN